MEMGACGVRKRQKDSNELAGLVEMMSDAVVESVKSMKGE